MRQENPAGKIFLDIRGIHVPPGMRAIIIKGFERGGEETRQPWKENRWFEAMNQDCNESASVRQNCSLNHWNAGKFRVAIVSNG